MHLHLLVSAVFLEEEVSILFHDQGVDRSSLYMGPCMVSSITATIHTCKLVKREGDVILFRF